MECLLIDRSPLYTLGFTSLLRSNFPDWKFSSASSLSVVPEFLDDLTPDGRGIIVVDIQLCSEQGMDHLSRLLHGSRARFGIVLLGTGDSRNAVFRGALRVDAFLARESHPLETMQLLGKVSGSGTTLSTTMRHMLDNVSRLSLDVDEHDRRSIRRGVTEHASLPPMTDRQRELIGLLLEGCSNKQIASMLDLTYGTVKNYMLQLMRLFNVRSRLELVARCRKLPNLHELS